MSAVLVKALFESTLQVQTHSPLGWFLIPYELLNKAVERGSNLQTMLSGASGETQIHSLPYLGASRTILYLLSRLLKHKVEPRFWPIL